MALQKQLVSIPLGVGANTKVDAKQLQPGKLLTCENAVFTKVGQLTKRYGLGSLGNQILGSNSPISNVRQAASFFNELNLITNDSFYTYSSAYDKLINKGAIDGAFAQSTRIISNTYQQNNPDMTVSAGLILHAWEDSSGGVRASVFDQVTGQPVASNVLISTTGIRPKCASTSRYLYVFYSETASTTIKSVRLDPQSPTNFSSPVTLATNAHATFPYIDTCNVGANIVLTYRNATPAIVLGYIRADGNFGTPADNFPAAVTFAENPTDCLSVTAYFQNDTLNDGIYLLWGNNGAGGRIRAAIYDIALSNSPSAITVDSGIVDARNISSINISAGQIKIWYEIKVTPSTNNFIKVNTLTRSGTAGTASVFMKSVGINSKPWTYNGKFYLIISHNSTLQAGFWTVNDSGVIVNRISYQNGGGNTNKDSCVASSYALTATSFGVPTVVKTQVRSESGQVYTQTGIQLTTIGYDNKSLFQSIQIGKNLLIAAGILIGYDGQNINELGFNLYPEGVAAVDNGAGTLSAGTYQWSAIYEWVDQQGQIHRSTPSIGVSLTLAAGRQVTITVPTLRVTAKNSVNIAIYRTEANKTTFYRVTSFTSQINNDKTVDSVTFNDNNPDSAIISNELLYTSGGVIENIPPPSCKIINFFNDRVFLGGLEDQNEYWYSKKSKKDYGIEFSDVFTGRIDQGRLGITGLGNVDDAIVLFKQNQMYGLNGEGPVDTGALNDYQVPKLISSDVGCTEHKSVVKFPDGIIFKTQKGYYTCDRTLQVSYIGADVEGFNSLDNSSSVLIDNTNQIRFTNSNGVAVVYDYYFKQWSTFTNYECVSATMWNGSFVLARSNGEIVFEDTNSYLDNGVPVQMRVVTPWISTAGIQGFQRIYQGIFLGEYKSDHLFLVSVGYNFEDHYRETKQINVGQVLGSNYYGQDAYYGYADEFGGVNDAVEQFKIKPMIQKCQSIRFEIKDLNPNAVDGAGMFLSNMTLLAGVKGGLNRVPTSKVVS